MERCSEEHADEGKRVDVTLWAQLLDLMFPKLFLSGDDVELSLCWIDETGLENHGDKLNIDAIAEIYRPIEYVHFVSP